MPRFAVYYIPPAHSPFYRLGTSILGYDIRREQATYPDNPIRAQIPEFIEAFVNLPQPHGLHCTIVAPQLCKSEDLTSIESEIELVLNCFAETTVFSMQAEGELLKFWGKEEEIVVLGYNANPAFMVLHTLLASRLVKFSQLENSKTSNKQASHYAHRSKHFGYPFLFDEFTPHFTLLYPYTGKYHSSVRDILHGVFRGFTEMTIESICLIVQEEKGQAWRIAREFHRSDYPQEL